MRRKKRIALLLNPGIRERRVSTAAQLAVEVGVLPCVSRKQCLLRVHLHITSSEEHGVVFGLGVGSLELAVEIGPSSIHGKKLRFPCAFSCGEEMQPILEDRTAKRQTELMAAVIRLGSARLLFELRHRVEAFVA